MPNIDISRDATDLRKHYDRVQMQQGRVLTDDDFNEAEWLDAEDARRVRVDVIGPAGSPDDGFKLKVVAGEVTMSAGQYYVGGLRLEIENDEPFNLQKDWLQQGSSPGETLIPPPAGERYDFVWLDVWQQPVSAVEDKELLEAALGGADTSARIRTMRRARVLTGVGKVDCAQAWTQLLTSPDTPGTLNGDFELIPNASLKIEPDGTTTSDDLCSPPVNGGYLGAENQAIRVQIVGNDQFTWGFDNGAPLYRIKLLADNTGALRQIHMLTVPKDQAHYPLEGQVVELLPWSALLSNGQKNAELSGFLAKVNGGYNPDTQDLFIDTAPGNETESPPGTPFGQRWSLRSDSATIKNEDPDVYFYMRVWNRGADTTSPATIGFVPGTAVSLAKTGLKVTFSGTNLRKNDFWVIAVRPETPDAVVPWELSAGRAPHGVRRWIAPLGVIHWLGPNAPPEVVDDCRPTFPPLTRVKGCCTVTVGDGISSHGDFDSIEEAVASLPDAGGEVCVLSGLHRADVSIVSRQNITVKGCDKLTQVIPRDANQGGAIFRVIDSRRIALRGMEMITLAGTAIALESSGKGVLQEIDISENRIVAAVSAIQVRQGVDIHIHHNRIRILDKDGSGIAIRMLADDSVIERNDIGVVPADRTPPPDVPEDTPDPTDPCADPVLLNTVRVLRLFADHIFGILITTFPVVPFKALGGIQIAAGSERVKVLENAILGGAGNGIMLGGIIPVPAGPILSQTPQTIESAGDRIQGQMLRADGTTIPGISVSFTRADGAVRTAVSGSRGSFTVRTEPGPYTVAVAAPAFHIESIAARDDAAFGRFHNITLAPVERPAPDDALAFLYEIQIDRNEISLMGLSGIGYPMVAPGPILIRSRALSVSAVTTSAAAAVLELLGNPVLTLGIHRNRIHDCFQNIFDSVLRDEATRRGFGGISLGFCEDVTISSNRIERNGRSHLNPVCGIFIRFGEKVNIHHNHIAHNGPFATSVVQRGLDPGIRGGIVLFASSFGIEEVFLRGDLGFDIGRHAARVHENIVYQPAGHALRLLAIGPVSVCDNHLVTEFNGPEVFERLAGAVFVLTAGGAGRLPTAVTLFNSNQTSLGDRAASLTSQIVWTTDDIGFDGNQSVALTKGVPLTAAASMLINTFLLGRTLRATDSRFKEPIGREQAFTISLLTRTNMLNNTNDNHGDHCIFAVNTAPGRPAIVAGNQVVDSTLCPTLNNSIAAPVSGFAVSATIRG